MHHAVRKYAYERNWSEAAKSDLDTCPSGCPCWGIFCYPVEGQSSPVSCITTTVRYAPPLADNACHSTWISGVIGGFALDRDANFYVSSRTHNQVYFVKNGSVRLLAGVGGSSAGRAGTGDNGRQGNLYIAAPVTTVSAR